MQCATDVQLSTFEMWQKIFSESLQITKDLTPWSSCSREANCFLASQELSSHFVEPKGSLLCSQEPTTCPYSEPDESNPIPILFFEYRFQFYLHIYAEVF